MSNKKRIILYLDQTFIKQLHDSMNLTVVDDNNIIRLRTFEGGSKNQWYKECIRTGLNIKLLEFEKSKKELEDKDEV